MTMVEVRDDCSKGGLMLFSADGTDLENSITPGRGLQVVPNPARTVDQVEVVLVNEQGVVNYRLISSAEQLVRTWQSDQLRSTIDIHDLSPGVYLIQAEGMDEPIVKKLVITR